VQLAAKGRRFEALILTVDVPVAGMRRCDVRNGFPIPPTLTLKNVADIATHPAWWVKLLTTRPLTVASLSAWDRWLNLEWVRACWDGPWIINYLRNRDA
jgi:L-lactate dehydrogenase (cytochrome)